MRGLEGLKIEKITKRKCKKGIRNRRNRRGERIHKENIVLLDSQVCFPNRNFENEKAGHYEKEEEDAQLHPFLIMLKLIEGWMQAKSNQKLLSRSMNSQGL